MAAVTPEFEQRIRELYPWMSSGMVEEYTESYSSGATPEESMQLVRRTPAYAQKFPGNFDSESGNVRMTESEYFASKASFDATLLSLNVNPDYFDDEFVLALESEVSPTELETRAEAAYERIVQAAPDIRAYYAENFGIEMSDSAIVASVLSPKVNDMILNRQITMAEIGGTAASRGFDIAKDMSRDLVQQGLDASGAQQLFGAARTVVPVLDVLAQRHEDPDDEFNLESFIESEIYDDPDQRRRIRRLVAQERASFTGQAAFREGRTGGVTGLAGT